MKRDITSALSQMFGKFANYEFPKPIQNIINRSYVGLMGLDMSEFAPTNSYSSLNKLFTRRLKQPRNFSLDGDDFIAPSDAWISEHGVIKNDTALQIKGMQYSCSELLGEHFSEDEKAMIDGGAFVNFYLSPKDYHRYHIPINSKIIKVSHIPGKFYPVNVPSLKKRVNLFIENERVVLQCQTQNGKNYFMVLVSALNVGVMQVAFEPNIRTNLSLQSSVYAYENLNLDKGDDFGCFEMGSTIVILSQKNMLELNIDTNEHVKYGQTIAKVI